MLKSMTGFGRGEFLDESHRLSIEIKAVNHRYNEIVVRMPKNLASLEDKIRRKIAASLARGRIDVFITVEEYGEATRSVRVDKELAIAYHKAISDLATLLNMTASESVSQISRYPDVLKVEEVREDVSVLWPKIAAAADAAIQNLMSMRIAEGDNIEADFIRRIADMKEILAKIEVRAPQVVSDYRQKISERMNEFLQPVAVQIDEGRLLQEVALFADRISITEEIVRLKSHFDQFMTILNSGEAVGRKLDFLVQEFNRETNTIASKANDYQIATLVVEMKSEIEKIREQIQNIE
ncbi:MAG: YicC/YloC family endoribonuclease [Sporomusaceae bacterium]|nr:YicC/YloC family endoribonuclease [Sporomusaceae bacterium]